jgi:hypothetical protein
MKAAASVIDGFAAFSAGKANRRIARENERSANMDGAAEEQRIREAARAAMGRQAASQAASGFEPGTGSAIDELRESALNSTIDILLTRRRTAAEAKNQRIQGRAAYRAGVFGLAAGAARAAGELADYKKGG